MKCLIVFVVLLVACAPVKNDCFKANNAYDRWDIRCQ